MYVAADVDGPLLNEHVVTLFQLLNDEARGERLRFFIAAILAGVANSLILALINTVAAAPDSASASSLFLLFALILANVHYTRYTNRRSTVLIESLLHRIKVRVSEKIARAELNALERVGIAQIVDRITENTAFISDRSDLIVTLITSFFVLIFAGMYIAWLSPAAFALIALICAAGAVMFVSLRQEFVVNVKRLIRLRVAFLTRLTDLLQGFKEIKFSRKRGRDVRDDVILASDELRAMNIQTSGSMVDGILLGDGVRFALLSAVVYTLHRYAHLDAGTSAALVAGVMFLMGPFMGLTAGLMPLTRANLALAEIDSLEQKLEVAARSGAPHPKANDPWQGRVSSVTLHNIEYAYPKGAGGENFHVGPLSFTIEAGTIVFIVGGNGSGKSTLLKVLTGLYPANAGVLAADGISIGLENVVAFRDMISAIYSDFHLFTKLYGLADVPDAAVRALLAKMRIDGQTSFVNRQFTKITLSTGQKKRLAMVVALLEDKPICVFDEWAADQDPEFRAYFYDELLPMLRQEGKIVIVVSHDDRYFHCADQVITMEYGKIRSIEERARMQVAS